MTDWVAELCQYCGVTSEYRGFDGEMIRVSRETQIAVLRALGVALESEADAQDILKAKRAEANQRPMPQEIIVTAGQAATLNTAYPVEWRLELENSHTAFASGRDAHVISLPQLPLGIHRLRMKTGSQDVTTWVLAQPNRAFSLRDCMAYPRIWGVLTALYGLTDGAEHGLGSYDALARYAEAMAAHGPDFIGINPIHAMGQTRPDDIISPYSPSHREFLNTWHCTETGPSAGPLVQYDRALANNVTALNSGFRTFSRLPQTSEQHLAFANFAASAGSPLQDFATFEALAQSFGPDWRDWPVQFHDPAGAAVATFAREHAQIIAQTKWAQWQADTQLAHVQSRATQAGMRLGLYLDLAVGPRLGGAETWGSDSALVTGATLGAPPDPLGPLGQSWGLAPQSPLKIRAQGYVGFARLLRAAMRHAGMIRIDHVLGLMRSFWIPEGGHEGTYVSYPFDALLAVVAIESVRNQTVVVGEDLGLVPAGLREKLATRGIYGLDVLQYMRTKSGGFAAPEQTRAKAVCTFATHDTPTITGFFAAEDARVRATFGGIDAETVTEIAADRARASKALTGADPVTEIHSQLARSNSELVAVQLDDVAGRKDQQNLPGTVDEYPNWRLRAPFSANEILNSSAFARLGAEMSAQHRANPKRMETDYDRSDCADLAH